MIARWGVRGERGWAEERRRAAWRRLAWFVFGVTAGLVGLAYGLLWWACGGGGR